MDVDQERNGRACTGRAQQPAIDLLEAALVIRDPKTSGFHLRQDPLAPPGVEIGDALFVLAVEIGTIEVVRAAHIVGHEDEVPVRARHESDLAVTGCQVRQLAA